MTNNPTRDELLPCPFCGHYADFIEADSDYGIEFYVACMGPKDCHAFGPPYQYNLTKEKAAEQWNTRATPPSQDGCREAFRELVETVADAKNPYSVNMVEGIMEAYDASLRVAAWNASQPTTSTEQIHDSSKLYLSALSEDEAISIMRDAIFKQRTEIRHSGDTDLAKAAYRALQAKIEGK